MLVSGIFPARNDYPKEGGPLNEAEIRWGDFVGSGGWCQITCSSHSPSEILISQATSNTRTFADTCCFEILFVTRIWSIWTVWACVPRRKPRKSKPSLESSSSWWWWWSLWWACSVSIILMRSALPCSWWTCGNTWCSRYILNILRKEIAAIFLNCCIEEQT